MYVDAQEHQRKSWQKYEFFMHVQIILQGFLRWAVEVSLWLSFCLYQCDSEIHSCLLAYLSCRVSCSELLYNSWMKSQH